MSWKLQAMRSLMDLPRWWRFVWASCAYDHRDPGNGKLFQKYQAFASNVDLSPLELRGACPPKSHQIVGGIVESGPRQGLSRATVSGEHPAAMCKQLVGILQRQHANN